MAETKVRIENPPVVLHTRPALDMDEQQFFEFCRLNEDWRIERAAEGDLEIMPPTVGETGSRNLNLALQLGAWTELDGSGVAFDSSTGFTLPNGAVRSPDIAWVRRERLADLTPEQKQRFLPLCPDFVIELRSPSDPLAPIEAKMDEYIENGARLGWLIDLVERKVHVYRPEARVAISDKPDKVSGGPTLPGFILGLKLIWKPGF